MRPKPEVVAITAQKITPLFDEDVLLVERYLAGDQDAMVTLYERYYDKVYSIARGVLGDADDAADAIQEIFALVCAKVGRFNKGSKFSTWLFRVAVNASIQLARKSKYRNRTFSLGDVYEPSYEMETSKAADQDIQSAMSKLPPADRALLVLYYWEDLPIQDIAESLGCSPNAAKTRLYRARERFKEVYEDTHAS